jgi:hypothetical protein
MTAASSRFRSGRSAPAITPSASSVTIGLLIENSKLATRAVYNYGTFSFDSLWLIPKFMLGKYRYWLSVQTFEQTWPPTPGPWGRRASLSSSRRKARATRTCGNNLSKSSSTRLRKGAGRHLAVLVEPGTASRPGQLSQARRRSSDGKPSAIGRRKRRHGGHHDQRETEPLKTAGPSV